MTLLSLFLITDLLALTAILLFELLERWAQNRWR